jgi:hypothetical protein
MSVDIPSIPPRFASPVFAAICVCVQRAYSIIRDSGRHPRRQAQKRENVANIKHVHVKLSVNQKIKLKVNESSESARSIFLITSIYNVLRIEDGIFLSKFSPKTTLQQRSTHNRVSHPLHFGGRIS